jgi:hypothetical protein
MMLIEEHCERKLHHIEGLHLAIVAWYERLINCLCKQVADVKTKDGKVLGPHPKSACT